VRPLGQSVKRSATVAIEWTGQAAPEREVSDREPGPAQSQEIGT
jgi:hypothetical protein